MKLNLITHENTEGAEISSILRSCCYSEFKLAVAYAKTSGIGRIYRDLTHFANNGGKIEAIIGIDQSNTSYQALVNLKSFTNKKLYIHKDRNLEITFHPKIYLFGNGNIEKVIIGSSNLTAGGFYFNFEANVGITLDNSQKSKEFKDQVNRYWDSLISDKNTKLAEDELLKRLLELGKIVDETRQRSFREIIEREISLPFRIRKRPSTVPPVARGLVTEVPTLSERFAMTLSGFDVSSRSQDPVVLIPKDSLKTYPLFWNWPDLYTLSYRGYPQFYTVVTVKVDNKTYIDQHIRIYYYESKKEFRLQCELIKRNGSAGDILLIKKNERNPLAFELELIRTGSTRYNSIRSLLTKTAAGKQKHYNFF